MPELRITAFEDEHPVTFFSAGNDPIRLAGMLAHPVQPGVSPTHTPGTPRTPLAILCHPQPLTTTMDDPLLRHLALRLAEHGFLTLRFNFRGAGDSEGEPTDGRLEPLDLAGAVRYMLTQPGADASRLCVVGHAFGAYIALVYAAADPRIRTVVAASPPLYRMVPEMVQLDRPSLFLTAEHDELCPPYKLQAWLDSMPAPHEMHTVPAAAHLLRGSEATAARTVVQYLLHWAMLPSA